MVYENSPNKPQHIFICMYVCMYSTACAVWTLDSQFRFNHTIRHSIMIIVGALNPNNSCFVMPAIFNDTMYCVILIQYIHVLTSLSTYTFLVWNYGSLGRARGIVLLLESPGALLGVLCSTYNCPTFHIDCMHACGGRVRKQRILAPGKYIL